MPFRPLRQLRQHVPGLCAYTDHRVNPRRSQFLPDFNMRLSGKISEFRHFPQNGNPPSLNRKFRQRLNSQFHRFRLPGVTVVNQNNPPSADIQPVFFAASFRRRKAVNCLSGRR